MLLWKLPVVFAFMGADSHREGEDREDDIDLEKLERGIEEDEREELGAIDAANGTPESNKHSTSPVEGQSIGAESEGQEISTGPRVDENTTSGSSGATNTLNDGIEDEFTPRRRPPGRALTFTSSLASTILPDPVKRPNFLSRALDKAKCFILQSDSPTDTLSSHNGKASHSPEHMPTYRYLPILSGIVIPFSILLEIPGLTGHWYIRTDENHQTIEFQRNPAILDVGMAISMVCAVVANVAVILRFFEVHIHVVTLTAIAMLTAHDIINAITVTTFGVIHRFDDGFTYGQSFWFTVCSTVASLITNVTLIVDYIGTSDFATSGSGLTRKQRSLVIVVMILLMWIAFGALINSFLLDLTFIDGMYFTVVTIETVGFGDITPSKTSARIFAVLHATIGILNLALAVSTCRETIIEGFEHGYRKRVAEIRKRRMERRAVRSQRRAKGRAVERCLREAGLPVYIPDDSGSKSSGHFLNLTGHSDNNHSHKRFFLGGGRGHPAYQTGNMVLNTQALSEEQMENVLKDALKDEALSKGGRALIQSEIAGTVDEEFVDTSFKEYCRMVEQDQQKEFKVKLSIAWSLFLMFWLIGSVIFMRTEGWSFGIAAWFCFEAFSTVGYGDFTPKTPAGRSVFIVWALLGVGNMTILISVLSEAYSSRYRAALDGSVNMHPHRSSSSDRLSTGTGSDGATLIGFDSSLGLRNTDASDRREGSETPRREVTTASADMNDISPPDAVTTTHVQEAVQTLAEIG